MWIISNSNMICIRFLGIGSIKMADDAPLIKFLQIAVEFLILARYIKHVPDSRGETISELEV